ncbi:SGNH/GDSL hydrolase family protein [Phytoactinopolyspora halotolerans]|uniref:SGNH/GDSL hydrolase family protein n=1 Tax=Phytoactinopolyspora halotolerans TaxID=1981512 RepID=A0A6L9SC58_9ACTN|nr:SGNH/GDSL hydrolase family protein [Phytoactinopolyspora halotolerans]NEE02816.1 SGNH/GDSL hydrolase family protein [Phytoactinopolyspora halotolerans]
MRLVSIGDSFTEGVGDERDDGSVRGWADFVATGLAISEGAPIEYANLAIRGKLMEPIVREQLEPALALEPTMLTFNGGGNDMIRHRANLNRMVTLTEHVITRCLDAGVRPVILSGGDPTRNLPLGRWVRPVGNRLTAAVREMTTRYDVPFADNWSDPELRHPAYWCEDRLHLNASGHRRVAARVLQTLGALPPEEWMTPLTTAIAPPSRMEKVTYYRRYVLPWIGRRLTGRSSGDGRYPKYAQWRTVEPRLAD